MQDGAIRLIGRYCDESLLDAENEIRVNAMFISVRSEVSGGHAAERIVAVIAEWATQRS